MSVLLSNSKSYDTELLIELWGDILPFPVGVDYVLSPIIWLEVSENTVVIFAGDLDVSVHFQQYHIFTSEVYSGADTAYPDIPKGMSIEEFIKSVMAERQKQKVNLELKGLDNLSIRNGYSHPIDMLIEPWGDVVPFPSGATFVVSNISEIYIKDDKVVVYTNGSNVSVSFHHREIFSSERYYQTSESSLAAPDSVSAEELIYSISKTMTKKRTDLLDRIAYIPERLAESVEQLEDMSQPAGEWSLRTIVVHLIVVDTMIWLARLTMMAEQDIPHWKWTEPDLAEWEKRYESLSLLDLLEKYTQTRQGIVDHLAALDEAGWNRIGTHATFGQMDVAGLCVRILEHDEEHLLELKKRAA